MYIRSEELRDTSRQLANLALRLAEAAATTGSAIAHARTAVQQPTIGQAWAGQGGIYVGVMRGAPGKPAHHLIVSPRETEYTGLAWGPTGTKAAGADCEWDGKTNTQALLALGPQYAAARYCGNLSVEGHSDFYLPSRRELALCYAQVPDAFPKEWHWSSTQLSADWAWSQYFLYGGQSYYGKDYEGRVRAVRRLVIESFSHSTGGGQ